MNYNISRATRRLALAVSRMAPLPQLAHSAPEWSAAMQPKIDAAVTTTLKGTGVPAASVAIVVDRRIAYLKSYGFGRLSPARAADNSMRSSSIYCHHIDATLAVTHPPHYASMRNSTCSG